MKKKIIGNLIIAISILGLFGITLDSGYAIGSASKVAYYEQYQAKRDALIGSMFKGTNYSYSYAAKFADDYLNNIDNQQRSLLIQIKTKEINL